MNAFLKTELFNRYSHILFAIFLLFTVSPILVHCYPKIPHLSYIFIIVIMLGLRVGPFHRVHFIGSFLILVSAFLMELSVIYGLVSFDTHTLFAAKSVYAIFMGLILLFINLKMFSEENVNLDTIQGGIVTYLLLGLFWTILYKIAMILDPLSIDFSHVSREVNEPLIYFSFTTLTTLGYGDITPASQFARMLTSLEAIVGQLYLTIFVARLIGLHVATNIKKID